MERVLRECLPGGAFPSVSPTRSRHMAAVRGRGNKATERRFRSALVRAEVRGWKLHPRDVDGHPDFFFRGANVAVFVDGCFWHGCPRCGHVPETNALFWRKKIERNRRRDRLTTRRLRRKGVRVVRIWEHALLRDLRGCVQIVRETLNRA